MIHLRRPDNRRSSAACGYSGLVIHTVQREQASEVTCPQCLAMIARAKRYKRELKERTVRMK